MSEQLLSPQAYIQGAFGEACQEQEIAPTEVVQLLLLDFIQLAPERRAEYLRKLKRDVRLLGELDFKTAQSIIDDAIETIEGGLRDAIELKWVTSLEVVVPFAPKSQPEASESETVALMLGTTEILIIIAVFGVLLFGPAFLRKIGTAAADTIREYRKVKDELATVEDTPVKK